MCVWRTLVLRKLLGARAVDGSCVAETGGQFAERMIDVGGGVGRRVVDDVTGENWAGTWAVER